MSTHSPVKARSWFRPPRQREAHRIERALSPEHRTAFWLLGVFLSILVAVIVGGITAGIVAAGRATYQSEATVLIDQAPVVSVTVNPGEIAKLVALRYKYAGIVQTRTFADQVSAASGVPAGAVQAETFTTVPANQFVFSIGARDHDGRRAERIAQADAQQLQAYVRSEQKSARVPARLAVTIRVVSPATAAVKVSPSAHRELGAAGLAALITFTIAIGIQTLRMYRFLNRVA